MQVSKDALIHRCSFCGEPGQHLRCTGCKGVTYCDQKHQRADWRSHKPRCLIIQEGLKKLQIEEKKIQNNPPGTFWPGNLFKTGVGHFWGILDTRDYMRARHHVAWELQHLPSREAVKTSLGHFRDMIRLSRSDNMATRNVIPGLYLRLKKDQEAYDFIKWYATAGNNPDYDWGNIRLPFLNLKDEDVMEDWRYFEDGFNFSHLLVMCLIKLRMLLDLRDIKVGNCDWFDHTSLRSGVWWKRPELLQDEGRDGIISKLQKDVDLLFDRVEKKNEHFWVCLLNHEENMFTRIEYYSAGNLEEAIMALQTEGRPWIETAGALEWVHDRVVGRGRW